MGTIAKVTAGGATHLIASTAYGTCSTGEATTDKVATIQDSQAFTLIAGETVHIYFTNTNSATSPTLNVNSTGAKPIRLYGNTVPNGGYWGTSWKAKSIVSFTYNTDLVSTGCWLMNDATIQTANSVIFDYQGAQTDYGAYIDSDNVYGAIIDVYEQAVTTKNTYQFTINNSSVSLNKTYSAVVTDYGKSRDVIFTGSDGLTYDVVSLNDTTRTMVLSAVDTTNSCIKIITATSSTATTTLSGTITTIPIGGSGGGSYILEYGQPVIAADVLSAMNDDSVIVCYDDEDPDFFYAYLDDHYAESTSLDSLEFIRTSVGTTGTTVYKYVWDSTQTAVSNGWSLTSYTIPNAYPYLQATGTGTATLMATSMTQISLTSTGQIGFGTGLSVVSGGIKVSNAGVYRVSGSVHLKGGSSPYRRGVFLRSGQSYANSTEFLGTQTSDSSSYSAGLNIGPKLISLSANDIVFLCARSSDGDGTAYCDNSATYLLVEQVVSQGDAGIAQQLNYLPNADITEY